MILYEIRKSIEEIERLNPTAENEDSEINGSEQMLLDTVRKLINLSVIARKEGLLELEEEAGKLPDTEGYHTLKMLIDLIVDGNDPELIEDMGLLMYFSSGISDYRALQHLIMMIGMRDIQVGENPRIFEKKIILALPKKLADIERNRLKGENI